MSETINTYSIEDVFNSGKYVIPIYQRNYAWGEPEISQLIRDIYDFACSEKREATYYIGTLVVYERYLDNGEVIYETIDGQQRLTTLNILVSVINRAFKSQLKKPIDYQLNLFFDSRRKSTETLEVLTRQTEELQYDPSKDYNPNIQQAYRDAEKTLKKLLTTDEKLKEFYEFFTKKVHIMRVSVPRDTNLNHYFEIMNTRGEQLEKHEILKAKLMEVIQDDEALVYAFDLIWEACADMERYVQYGFNIPQRDALFTEGDWNQVSCDTLEEVAELVFPLRNKEKTENGKFTGSLTQTAFFDGVFALDTNQTEDAPDRFTTIINFSNFLLHVLRVFTEEDISLDDKRLLDIFNEQLAYFSEDPEGKVTFVKEFGYNLLWCKWLFDNYIIKREFIREKNQWSLKRLKWYKGNRVSYVNTFGKEDENSGENKELVMLLSMFHVSTPTLVYKHWLNAALNYVYQDDFEAKDYINYLIELARAFLNDQYLALESKKVDFYGIIYENSGKSQNKGKKHHINIDVLHSGTMVENFIFNFLDFILWKQQVDGYDKFDFAFRSSVEHYYPQNPIAKDYKIDQSICDMFGNLCLISSSKNSKLSNNLPEAKKDYYLKAGIDSLKQSEMMKLPEWDEKQIKDHGKSMIDTLLNF